MARRPPNRAPASASFAIGAIATLALAAPAAAGGSGEGGKGALGQVTSGIRTQTTPPPPPPAPSGGSSGGTSSTSDPGTVIVHDDPGDYYGVRSYTGVAYHPVCYTCGLGVRAHPGQGPTEPVRVDLDMGLHSVEDSDGAVTLAARISQGGLGVGARVNSYFERDQTMVGAETIRMDVWSLFAMLRLGGTDATEVWAEGGLASTRSNQFESIFGGAGGLRATHYFNDAIAIDGSARYYAFEDDVRAKEYRVGLRAAFVHFGYRVLDYNVGPPLQGPDFGFSLRF